MAAAFPDSSPRIMHAHRRVAIFICDGVRDASPILRTQAQRMESSPVTHQASLFALPSLQLIPRRQFLPRNALDLALHFGLDRQRKPGLEPDDAQVGAEIVGPQLDHVGCKAPEADDPRQFGDVERRRDVRPRHSFPLAHEFRCELRLLAVYLGGNQGNWSMRAHPGPRARVSDRFLTDIAVSLGVVLPGQYPFVGIALVEPEQRDLAAVI